MDKVSRNYCTVGKSQQESKQCWTKGAHSISGILQTEHTTVLGLTTTYLWEVLGAQDLKTQVPQGHGPKLFHTYFWSWRRNCVSSLYSKSAGKSSPWSGSEPILTLPSTYLVLRRPGPFPCIGTSGNPLVDQIWSPSKENYHLGGKVIWG